MGVSEPAYSTQPVAAGPSRPRNGLGVAALVIGVASLVAGLSFVLFPLALIGGGVGLGIPVRALPGGGARGAANPGQGLTRPLFRTPGRTHALHPRAPLRGRGAPHATVVRT